MEEEKKGNASRRAAASESYTRQPLWALLIARRRTFVPVAEAH